MEAIIDKISELFPLIAQGQWMMIPIVACSLLALAVVLERTWVLIIRSGKIIPRPLLREVEQRLSERDIEGAVVACRKSDSMMARVLLAGLNMRGRPREVIREAIVDAGRRESHELDRFLNMLGAIAGVSPLLGLLGTVIGMIKVFQQISSKHIGQYEALAEGIYVALITTAAGLIVAIPAYLFYRVFAGMAERKLREMEDSGVDLLNRLDDPAMAEAIRNQPVRPEQSSENPPGQGPPAGDPGAGNGAVPPGGEDE